MANVWITSLCNYQGGPSLFNWDYSVVMQTFTAPSQAEFAAARGDRTRNAEPTSHISESCYSMPMQIHSDQL